MKTQTIVGEQRGYRPRKVENQVKSTEAEQKSEKKVEKAVKG